MKQSASRPVLPIGEDAMIPPWISYCSIEGRAIFLDVRANRYFMLSESAAEAFAGGDLAKLNPAARATLEEALALMAAGYSSRSTASPIISAAFEQSAEVGRSTPSMLEIALAIKAIATTRIGLAAHSLDTLLWKAQRLNRTCAEAGPTAIVGDLVAAFEIAERLTVGRDRCLLRSLALQKFLARYGYPSAIVFGVRLHPFRAHCWLQREAIILNDTIEVTGPFSALRSIA